MEVLKTTGNRAHDAELNRIEARIKKLEAAAPVAAAPAPSNPYPVPTGAALAPAVSVTDVGASAVGLDTTYAREDHEHLGVRSIEHSTDGQLYGDILVSDSTNIGIATTGQTLKFTWGSTKNISVNYLATGIDSTIIVGANSLTITLPDATLEQAHLFIIKNGNFTGTTVSASGGQTIDGAASAALAAAYAHIMLQSDGTNWLIVG